MSSQKKHNALLRTILERQNENRQNENITIKNITNDRNLKNHWLKLLRGEYNK